MTRNYQDEPQVFRVATSSLWQVSFHQLLQIGVGDPWGPNLVVLSRTENEVFICTSTTKKRCW